MSNKKIYKFREHYGRMGMLSGVFVADADDVARVMGKDVYLGEVLGKHSDVTVTVSRENLREVSDSPVIVAFFEKELGGGVGTNPIETWLDSDENGEFADTDGSREDGDELEDEDEDDAGDDPAEEPA
jgi:hypothetical protein